MKKTILLSIFLLASCILFAQKKTTTSAIIAFDASTSVDNLPKAENKTAIAAIDTKTGSLQFEAAVKNFAFSNPGMQGHFNGANWMNSDAFPKFSFNGNIENLSKVNLAKDGSYAVSVAGNLTIKDVTKPVTVPGIIIVKGNAVSATAEFSIKLADYSITGVPIDAGKVSKEPKIKVTAELK